MLLKELAKQQTQEAPKRKVKVVEDDTVYHKGKIKSRPDFVLVYKTSKVTLRSIAVMEEFLRNLEDVGVMYETSTFTANNDVIFIRLYAPTSILYYSAELYFIELACNSADFKPPVVKPRFRFMRTELTDPQFNGIVHRRAPQCLNITKPKGITNAERILVLYTILMNTRFGKGIHDYGLEKLISKGIFECSFPLHDGHHEWTDTGSLNERQLLKKYWSSFRCFNKEQPLDMIHHYFGTQTSFYFAWVGFYNKMLIPASIGGICCFVLGLILYRDNVQIIRDEVCSSNMKLCPRCHTKHCIYLELKHSCWTALYSYAFNNPMTFTFAILMSCWAALVMRLWKRQETILTIKWDLRSLEIDTSMRYGYIEKATKRRISRVSGEEEPYVPQMTTIACYAFTITVMIGLVVFNVACVFIIMLLTFYMSILIIKYSSIEFLRKRSAIISSITGSIASAIFVKLFSLSYHKLTWWLTNIENPRSQLDFDNSYILKLYILAFVNNYSTVFYIAFFKGTFYTHPGDQQKYTQFFGIATDTCDPSGCAAQLGFYIVLVMVGKRTLMMNALKFLLTIWHKIVGHIKEITHLTIAAKDLNRPWEMDYMLKPITKLDIIQEYLDMAIQYGYVTFFVACFPLAPVFALIENLIQMRVDAARRLVIYRRTIPFKVMGLGAWYVIFQAATFIGIVTNAAVIVFTCNFISQETYRLRYSMKGYTNFTLSVLLPLLRDSYIYNDIIKIVVFSTFIIKGKAADIVPLEAFDPPHVLLALTGLIAFLVPTVPFSIKQLINNQEEHYKNLRIAEAEEQMQKNTRKTGVDGGRNTRYRTQNRSTFNIMNE